MKFELILHISENVDGRHREILVPRAYAIIGSDRDSDVSLPNLCSQSPRRIYLQAVDEGVISIDLASRPRARCSAPAEVELLGNDEPLIIGEYSLTVDRRCSDASSGEQVQHRLPRKRLSNHYRKDVFLEFINGRSRTSRTSHRFLRDVVTLIGRGSRCHVRLSHGDIPEFHSSIVRIADQIWLVSLSNDGDLLVNGRPARHVRLRSRDIISVGPFSMQVQSLLAPGSWTNAIEDDAGQPSAAPRWALSGPSQTQHGRRDQFGESVIARGRGRDQAELKQQTTHDHRDNRDASSRSAGAHTAALMEQLATLHQVLLEQSQLQSSLLVHLLENVRASQSGQEDLLREQIAAIKGIAKELQAWRRQSQAEAPTAPDASPKSELPPRLGAALANPALSGPIDPAASPDADREPKSQEDIETHASLAGRIGYLERERNSLIQKILNMFPGSP